MTGEQWPPALDQAAYHGVLGEIVREVAPHTEADPVGMLAVLISGIGNALGAAIHARVLGTPHPARLNIILVGKTREGAKGSAQDAAEAVLRCAVPGWLKGHRVSGLSTGEGLIRRVRDERRERQLIRENGRKTGQILGTEEVVIDVGVEDKRLWVVEGEFTRTIKVIGRDSNTLSDIIRDVWDGKDVETLTSGNPYRATAPHISIVGHITPRDLRRSLPAAELTNGFANRFLWFMVRRSQFLPDGDTLDPARLAYWGDMLGGAIRDARERLTVPLRRDEAASAKWHAIYRQLGQDLGGLAETVLSRPEAQILRLSVLYAALDVSPRITLPHLDAALAVWQFVHNSALCIFGQQTGDPIFDTILDALRERPLTQTEISNRFSRNVTSLADSVEELAARGLIVQETVPTRGRSATRWRLATADDRQEASQ